MTPCTLIAALALSSHLGLEGDYNGLHPSLKCDRDDTGLVAGVFLNSEDRVSAYAGVKLSSAKPGRPLWAEVGMVTGYTSADVLPFLRVGADLSEDISIFAAPAFEMTGGDDYRIGAVIGLELRL